MSGECERFGEHATNCDCQANRPQVSEYITEFNDLIPKLSPELADLIETVLLWPIEKKSAFVLAKNLHSFGDSLKEPSELQKIHNQSVLEESNLSADQI